MSKLPLISWSGGIDSTALVIWYFSKKIPFETIYVKLPNNKDQQKKELKARKKILKKLTELYGNYHINDNIISFVGAIKGSHLPSQAYIWATSISYNLDLSEYSKIVFGYIKRDEFWHIRPEFEQIILNSQRMNNRNFSIEFDYPIEWELKKDLIENYYNFNDRIKPILKLTHYCEGSGNDSCNCNKCKEYGDALYG